MRHGLGSEGRWDTREAISAEDLVAVYKDGTRAVEGISFSVNPSLELIAQPPVPCNRFIAHARPFVPFVPFVGSRFYAVRVSSDAIMWPPNATDQSKTG